MNCLCVGGPPYWPSRGDATPALVGGCKGWPPPPRPFFSIPLHIPHLLLASSPTLPLPSPSAFPSSRPFSILPRERLYTRLSVPLSGLRSYLRHSAPTSSSSSPPTHLCRYRRCITVRWRLLPPRDDPFRLAYRRARALSPTTTTTTTATTTTTTSTTTTTPFVVGRRWKK